MQHTQNRPVGQPSALPSGLRLMAFLEANLKQVLDRERNNDRRIHLYAFGGYWAAFDRSACQLCLRFPGCETAVLRVVSIPFPVVMAFVPDGQLRIRRVRMRRAEPEHEILTAPELSMARYKKWFKEQID